MAVALPQNIVDQSKVLHKTIGAFTVDGEIIGNKLWVFDMLEIAGEDVRSKPAIDRYMMALGVAPLLKNEAGNQPSAIEVCQTAFTAKSKQKMHDDLAEDNLESVVFKRRDSIYVSGRPSSGGTQLKLKFWESATLEVAVVNGDRRSVGVQAYDNGVPVALGNVTIAPNKTIPSVGDVVEVKYLYAFVGGSIFQPEFLGVRGDQSRDDCTISQLKIKSERNAPRLRP